MRNEFIIQLFHVSGNVDIVNGNLKLILGLIWSLIVRYQIGPSKFPPKKLMLAWLKVSSMQFASRRTGRVLFHCVCPGTAKVNSSSN